MQISELKGMAVLTSNGQNIGEVKEAEIDTVNWRVESLAVRLSRDVSAELGMDAKIIGHDTIQVSTNEISGAHDTVILTTSTEDLRQRLTEMKFEQSAAAP
jgi:sporulation protein YlmC with PRC-barrel domain